jgi:predicted Zn-dependent protease
MKTKITRKATWSAAVLGAIALGGAAIHFGCSKDGSGGGFGDNLAKIGGEIGSAVTGRPEIAQGTAAAVDYKNKISLSADDEDAMGQSVAMNLTSSNRLTQNEALNKYVSLVGLTLVDASPRPSGNWLFGVLESNEVNAFAGPNGYIFVTTGALRKMQDESELAGVLAHELTHVLHHHGLAGIQADANADAAKAAASIAINSNGADRFGIFNKLADPVVEGVVKKPYARGQELDADSNAVNLLVAAGYDPNGLVRFLQRLESSGGDPMSTHPGKAERVAKAQAQIARLGTQSGRTMKARFAKNVVLK